MEEIIVLIDYKSSFGSKYDAIPVYSGLDLILFSKEMENFGYKIVTKHFFEINFENPVLYKNVKILYQSAEANDQYSEYKSHIDDVLYFLKLSGAQLIPDYRYFKAHSNKFFMEMLRGFMDDKNKPKCRFYGSLEDFRIDRSQKEFPIVIKKSHGAQSLGVFKSNNNKDLLKIASVVSKSSFTIKEKLKEIARKLKYKNYIPFSINRSKFIIQSFTPNLTGDYKVLIFHDIFYLIKRKNRPNDFRASGGGFNNYNGEFEVPDGIIDYAYSIYEKFQCPYISLDIGINQNGFNLIEFQFINFGTIAQLKGKFAFRKGTKSYKMEEDKYSLEYLYSYSIKEFLKK